MAKRKKKRGRPRGSRNLRRVESLVEVSRCPAVISGQICHSTDRTSYPESPRVIESSAVRFNAAGQPYNRIEIRKTCCLACGTPRLDRFYLYTRKPDAA